MTSFNRVFDIEVNADGGISNSDRFSSSIKKADAATGGLVGKLGLLDKNLGVIAAGAAAVGAAVVVGTKKFNEYEVAIAEVNTLLGEHQSVKDYSDAVRQLAVEFGSSAPEQAGAAYQIVSAGARDAAEATDILTAANKLAVGGVTDILTASDGLTTILNAYNLEASSAGAVSDILFSTMKSGKTTIGELSSSLGVIVPTAAQLGVELPEVTAAIAALTTNGVATTEAVTQINAALSGILKVTPAAAKEAARLGIDFNAAALESKGLSGFLKEVEIAVDGDAEALAKLFPRAEALRGVMALTGDTAEKFSEILEGNENAAGSTARAYEIMAATTTQNFGRLKAAVNELAISFGEDLSPVVNLAIDGLEGLVQFVQMAYDGLTDLSVLIGGALYDSFVAWNELLFSGAFEHMNTQVTETIGILDVLGGVFSDTQLVGIALIRGLLLGWEELKHGTELVLASIAGGFDKAFGEIGDEARDLVLSIANAVDELPGVFGVSSTSLRKFAGEIRTSGAAAADFDKKMDALIASHETAKENIIAITDGMADEAIAAKSVGDETSALTKKLGDNTTATDIANQKNKDFESGLDDVGGSVNDVITQLNSLQHAATTFLLGVPEKITEFDNGVRLADKRIEELRDGLENSNEWLNTYADLHGDAAEDVNEYWATAVESMQGHLADYFRGGLDDFDSFADSMVGLVKDMLAEMAAAWAISGISQWLATGASTGDWTDTSGFNTGAFTGGGSLGGGTTSTGTTSNSIIDSLGESVGLTQTQTQGLTEGAGGVYNIYGGVQNYQNGNEVGGSLQAANGVLDTYNGYQNFTGGTPYTGTGASALGLAGSGYGLYTSVQNGDAVGTVINGYQTYQNASTLYGAYTGTGAALSEVAVTGAYAAEGGTVAAAVEGSSATGAAAAGGSATTAALGWAAVAVAADQWLNDGKIGEEGFKIWDERKEDVRSGAFGIEKAVLSEGQNFVEFVDGIFGGPGEVGLGYEQLEKLTKQLKSGEKSSYTLNDDANLVGNYNEGTAFFDSLNEDTDLSRVAEILKADYGFDKATELDDTGILRVADADGNFITDPDSVIGPVLESLAAVKTNLTDVEVHAIDAFDNMFIEMDANFDATADSGETNAERVKNAYMETYGASSAEADLWLENSGISADRWAEIMTGSSGQVLEGVIELGAQATDVYDAMGNSAEASGDMSESAINTFVKKAKGDYADLGAYGEQAALVLSESIDGAATYSNAAISGLGSSFQSLGAVAAAEAIRIQGVYRDAAAAAASVNAEYSEFQNSGGTANIEVLAAEIKASNDLTAQLVRERR